MTQLRRALIVCRSIDLEGAKAFAMACAELAANGIAVVVTSDEVGKAVDGVLHGRSTVDLQVLGRDCSEAELEVAIVLGGDGSILKAAELVRDANVPIIGVNLGHVGFLAEGERDELSEIITRLARREYEVTERMALDVVVLEAGQPVYRTWALNEATVEKSARERMLEVVLEVEEHPLSSFGCDGVVIATPTGSTAYAFSAGGPVVWPSVEAILMVPLSAHALFARPLVVNPESMLAVEVLRRSAGSGVLWCDGRRTFELSPGARVEVRKSTQPVRIVRLKDSPFTNRLVSKFSLPVAGWRGPEA